MRWGLLCLLAGCYKTGELPPVCGAECEDGGTPDVPLVEFCVGDGVGFLPETCFTNPSTSLPPTALIDTNPDSDGFCAEPNPANADFCFVAAHDIRIDTTIAVRGSRPLVLWSTGKIEITATGVLDVASHLADPEPAAGANDSDCSTIDGNADAGLGVGTGGCGGAFGTDSGLAGNAGDNGTIVITTCNASPVGTLDRLRGGCRGGNGGLIVNGGNSGGAVYLMAGAAITVKGTINASGAGAAAALTAGTQRPGGGGGGSGGMIAFDAPVLDLDGALLLALGGGGGSGSGDAGGAQNGKPGKEANVATGAFAGGASATINNNFGGGASTLGGDNGGSVGGAVRGGGGGGGGGHGVLRIFPPTLMPMGTFTAKPAFPPPPI